MAIGQRRGCANVRDRFMANKPIPPGMGGHRWLAIRTALIYAAFGLTWIISSDWVLSRIAEDAATLTRLQTAKGWVYVGVTALLIFWLVDRQFQAAERARAKLTESEREYEAERRRLQDELNQSQKMEAVGQLAGGVAHDLNNLLMVIFGYVDLTRRTLGVDHPAMKSLDGVTAAAQQASDVSRALLTFSRKMPVRMQVTDLNDAVARAVELLKRLLPAAIRLDVDLQRGRPMSVYADATQLQQVVMNLAINARDAMPDGGMLRIATLHVPHDGGAAIAKAGVGANARLRIVVADTGIGMAPEVVGRIFEPFFTTKPKGVGTGLGLSIVHGIVQSHGGTLRVSSSPGDGSTFTVELPALAEEAALPSGAGQVPSRGGGEVILVAEDNDMVRQMLASALASHGYEVLQAADGNALLETYAVNHERLRLIVTDIEMPGRDGLSCVRMLRTQGSHVPVILTTGSLTADEAGRLDENTVPLPKPYPMEQLVSLVGERIAAVQPSASASARR